MDELPEEFLNGRQNRTAVTMGSKFELHPIMEEFQVYYTRKRLLGAPRLAVCEE